MNNENPIISEKTDLTLDEAKAEFLQLKEVLNAKVFPYGGTGWSSGVLNRIEDRLTYLRTVITDFVCKEN